MREIETDILLVGSGLGATAAANSLARAGVRVTLITGIGRTRSAQIDGGVIDPVLAENAFGAGAPLGEPVTEVSTFTVSSGGEFAVGSATALSSARRYQRGQLETWAMEQATAAGAVFVDDFVEGHALPAGDEAIVLTSEGDDRVIRAKLIALCEGADPRIALRVGLRPDYGPEDQLHFARTLFIGQPVERVLHGAWRTGWGMPVEADITPQANGTLVSVVARIENIMRASRSSKDALRDLIASAMFGSLGFGGQAGDFGMELVAIRKERRGMSFVHDRLLMGIDFSGVIDPRRLDRADLTIRAGQQLADHLVGNGFLPDGWPARAGAFVRDALPAPRAYHDDMSTGYLEEGAPAGGVPLPGRVAGLLRRGRRSMMRTG